MRLTSILPIDRVTYSDAFFSCQQTALIRASSSMPHANCVIAMYVVTYRSYRKVSLRYLSIHEKKRSTTPRLAWVVDDKCLCVCENYENKKIKKRRMKNLYRIPMLILVF